MRTNRGRGKHARTEARAAVGIRLFSGLTLNPLRRRASGGAAGRLAGAYPADAVVGGASEGGAAARAAFAELYAGLKRDSEYDPTNGYKPRKPVPLE